MAISFNTGTTTTQTAVDHTVQPSLTVPGGVLAGDTLIVGVCMFTFTPTSPGITITPASGHTWTVQGGGLQASTPSSGITTFGACWSRQATSGDPGDTLTFAFTGTPGSTDQFWWAIDVVSYTGAGGVDVSAGFGGTGTGVPSATTGVANDWAVAVGCFGISGGGAVTAAPAGESTLRENSNTAGIACAISDSAASVGPAGTGIGGDTFTANNGVPWCASFILGVEPGAAPPPPVPQAVVYSMRMMP